MGILPDWAIARDVKITPAAEGIKREGIISYGYTSYGYDARAGYKWKVFSPVHGTEIDAKNFDPKCLIDVDLTPRELHTYEHKNTTRTGYYCSVCGKHIDKSITNPDADKNCEPQNYIRIPPHSFVLGETIEEFTIPRDVLCIVMGKSTYARCGLVVNVTPGEPEWCGKWTIEISNTTPLPARVYCGEGVMQCVFLRSDGVTDALRDTMSDMICTDQVMRLRFLSRLTKASCQTSYADKKGKYQNQTGLTVPTVDKTTDIPEGK